MYTSSQRNKVPSPSRVTPALIAVLLLAVITVATVILGHSLETDRQAEQLNQERFMRNIAFTVLDDLGAERHAASRRTAFGPFVFDTDRAGVFRGEVRLPLTYQEFHLLQVLIEHEGQVLEAS